MTELVAFIEEEIELLKRISKAVDPRITVEILEEWNICIGIDYGISKFQSDPGMIYQVEFYSTIPATRYDPPDVDIQVVNTVENLTDAMYLLFSERTKNVIQTELQEIALDAMYHIDMNYVNEQKD